jgi:hypothetical protein
MKKSPHPQSKRAKEDGLGEYPHSKREGMQGRGYFGECSVLSAKISTTKEIPPP